MEQAACGAPVGSPLTSIHPRMLLTISTLIVSATYYKFILLHLIIITICYISSAHTVEPVNQDT